AHGGAERRGYRHLEEEVVGVAGPLEGDEVLVRDLVSVQGHLVDVAGERRGHAVTGLLRRIPPSTEPRPSREDGATQLCCGMARPRQHALDQPLDQSGVAPRSVAHAASMCTRQLVVKRAAARPRVAEPLSMAYDSAAHEPARVPTRGPDGHAGHRAAVSRLPGPWARRTRRLRGLCHAPLPARDSRSLGTPAFPQSELAELIDHVAKLKTPERARHLSLLGVKTIDALRARLSPRVTAKLGDTVSVVRVEQESFDGKNHLPLALEGDARETVPTLSGSTVTVRRPAGGPVRLTVRVRTDAPALVPLGRAEIFNEDFQRFAAQVRADSAHPLRFRRLEREVRGVELLSYREKLMAGLPNFATYFGRDMLMTALLMQPVWAPAMSEHVVASALGKLSPTGDVSHEEALGGQAIRENAAEYNRLVSAGQLAPARALLAHLATT